MSRLSPEQARGALPTANAWMSASAGTGKTQVLTARILRLLLEGVAPQSILAITFTKAGAAEMARRIRKDLASWVQMDDKALSKALFAIHAPKHLDADMLSYARTLFARVIDAPGQGLAIQTIHGFCQSLLGAFPEEAGLAPGFQLLDDRELSQLHREVLAQGIAELTHDGSDPAMLARMERIALEKGEQATESYLMRSAGAVDALDKLPAGIAPWLRGALGLERETTPDTWLVTAVTNPTAQLAMLGDIAAANRVWGTATGIKQAAPIEAWIAADPATRAATMDAVVGALLTDKGGLRAAYANPKQCGDVEDYAVRAAAWLAEIRDTARHMKMADLLADALEVGRWFARLVSARKLRDGAVTYDDLIARTGQLLFHEGAAWIRYKLDQRIDHVLVDEAQDTNNNQWNIVWGLTQEFFAGEGAKGDAVRTLFVVGDTKQAIYGFQGTSPKFFHDAKKLFHDLGDAVDHPFDDVGIDTNFRSSQPVLHLVDQLIQQKTPEALGLDVDSVRHTAFADAAPGKVIIWPLEPPSGSVGSGREDDDGGSDEGWIDSATRRVAGRIAATVRDWVAHGLDGEAVQPGDVMVLVRKRADLAALIVSRLQGEGVPVAGIDRMQLGNPLAVRDLLSAMRFAMQPQDDLNLASLLVSPLIGWSHEELAARGWRMDDTGKFPISLWRHLNSQPALQEALQPLYGLLNMAGYANPHQFLESVLSGPMRGRARLVARLGYASIDPIEELVSQALGWTTRHGPSLLHFLAWFDSGTQDIKREQDNAEDAVRVMTVHGSKGLQARIVILADAAGNPRGRQMGGFDWAYEGPGSQTVPLLPLSKADRPGAIAADMATKEDEELKEHWRLLYVAATRAERILCVAGAMPSRGDVPADNWYTALNDAAEALGGVTRSGAGGAGGDWGEALVYAKDGREEERRRDDKSGETLAALPDWAYRAAPQEARPPKPLAPSADVGQEELSVPLPPALGARSLAMLRGTLIHALFERLPATPVTERRAAALRFMAARGAGLDTAVQEAAVEAVLAVLDHPDYARLFGPESLAEVPFSAVVDGRVIAGSVDRLVVSDTAVEVVDFKSGRAVPASLGDIPVGYLRQMAAYVAALRVIFPDRTVTASLLFSEGPQLFTLPDAALAAHVPGEKPDLSPA